MTRDPRKIAELAIHKAVVEALSRLAPIGALWFHCPNGEKRDKATASKLREMGVRPGVADLVILLPGKPVLFLELKAHGEKQSPDQVAFEIACGHVGAEYAIGDNIDAILNYLTNYGALTRRGQRAA